MPRMPRRIVLGAAAAGLAGAGVASVPGTAASTSACPPPRKLVLIPPDDARYRDLAERGFNQRFVAVPEVIALVHTRQQVAAVVGRAVRNHRRIAIRSGGHCFEDLVDNPATQVLIDLSPMCAIYYDPRHRAIAVEAGATLEQVYRTMFLTWGVTVPAGICVDVGVGGHVAGGGYGPLSRRDGLVVDHLYAVEVVVVDATGRTRTIMATRDPHDPHHDLWWAHTGGGGGNFGVATRYLFRSPGASGEDPATLLPRPPASVLKKDASWSWADLDQADFIRLLGNHGEWSAQHGEPSSPHLSLYSALTLNQKSVEPGFTTSIDLTTQIDAELPGAEQALDDYIAAVGAGLHAQPSVESSAAPWLASTLSHTADLGPWARLKNKAAYLRRPWTDVQIEAAYRHLSQPVEWGLLTTTLYGYGGQINSVPAAATAAPQRDSILKVWFAMLWGEPALDEHHVGMLRELYRDIHAETGGVPVPDTDTDGCYINYPDADLRDPVWNSSGVPWSELYYKEGYARLQRVKDRYDPGNVFRHPLSVEPGA